MVKGKGNRRGQQYRRRHNNKDVEKQPEKYQMIDGNLTNFPYAYCTYYKGWLTKNMAARHKCECKNCVQFEYFDREKVMGL